MASKMIKAGIEPDERLLLEYLRITHRVWLVVSAPIQLSSNILVLVSTYDRLYL
jgi:hypothetical protein